MCLEIECTLASGGEKSKERKERADVWKWVVYLSLNLLFTLLSLDYDLAPFRNFLILFKTSHIFQLLSKSTFTQISAHT